MANKHIAKVFIDDTSGSLLDNLYRLVKHQTNNKKQAEKIVENIIKVFTNMLLRETLIERCIFR